MTEREQVCRRCKAEIERLRTAVAPLADIGKQLASQDRTGVAYPTYVVSDQVRDYGYTEEHGEGFIWVNEYGDEPEEGEDTADYHKAYYVTRLAFVAAFFTRPAAQRYIDKHGNSNLVDPVITVSAAHNNPEWQAVCEVLAKIPSTGKGGEA